MKLILIFLLSLNAHASMPEIFGSSAGSMALGNQAENDTAANNYYAGALLGFSKSNKFSFNSFYVDTHLTPINSIVTKNETNTVNQFEYGKVNVNSSPTIMLGIHLSTPLFSETGPKFNFSFFAPANRVLEADSGDPYQPQYAMYANRFIRPTFTFGLAQAFNDWALSIGAITGIQSNGETLLMTRTTSGNPSLGKISYNAKPSLGLTVSVAKKTEMTLSYFSFQQEMKSNLQMSAKGETEIASNASFPFDFKMTSLLYYDPMTLRAGTQILGLQRKYFFSLEYQHWSTYEVSTLKLKKQGGTINGSENYEKLKLKNIVIPKVGIEQAVSEKVSLKAGYFYRPSPIKTKGLKHAGNTIDVDKHVTSLGAAYTFMMYGKDVLLDLAYQAHFLKNQKIIKTAGREDGDPSEPKIGSPGYRIGGMIHVLSLGISWMY